MAVRVHNFAGIEWYDHEKDQLNKKIEWCFKHKVGPGKLPQAPEIPKKINSLLGIVSPHAGYSCSGPHASHGYLEISQHKNIHSVVVLGTNHTGMGSPTSLFPKGEWQTPLGSIEIDDELHDQFSQGIKDSKNDIGFAIETDAHIEEHSIDNQLPFLQYSIQNEFKLLPIVMWDHSLKTCQIIANTLSEIKKTNGDKVLIVASSDFTHYLSPSEAQRRDQQVLLNLIDFDLETAVRTQKSLKASICGFGPIVTLFAVGKQINMTKCEVLAYGHSGQTCGDNSRVVAYTSLIVGK